MLDGVKDDLEFRIEINNNMDHNLLYSTESVQPSSPLFENQLILVTIGLILVISGIGLENHRRKKAKQILEKFALDNKWD